MWHKDSIVFHVSQNQIASRSATKLYDAAKNNRNFVQRLSLLTKLPVHKGCVNTICWNDSGQWILSGADDQHLVVTHGYTHKVLMDIRTGHRANIFSAKFLPNTNDRHVVSCSGDGVIIFNELERPETSLYNVFNCHYGTTYEVTTVPNDPNTFLSCGEDGTVRWFDLRIKNSCASSDCKDDILINCRYAVTALTVNRLAPYLLGVGCADSNVCIFDRRMLGTQALGSLNGSSVHSVVSRFTIPELESKNHRITSLTYSPDGQEMLVSYSSDYIYLFNTRDAKPVPATYFTKGNPSGKSSKSAVKRLRVRGDWSDTGPNARPEAERAAVAANDSSDAESSNDARTRSPHANLMQRMSEVLNRFFHPTSRVRPATSENERQESMERPSTANPSRSHSEEGPSVVKDENPETTPKELCPNEGCAEFAAEAFGLRPQQESSTSNTRDDDTQLVADDAQPQPQASAQSSESIENVSPSRNERVQEPLVNLQYSGRGLNSGIITVETTEPGATSAEMIDTSIMLVRQYEDPPNSAPEPESPPVNRSPAAATSEENESFMMEIQEWDDYEDRAGVREEEDDRESDGRRSRRAVRDEDLDNSSMSSSSHTEAPTRRRNPRELLIGSFNDVLKHFKEERQQEKAYLATVAMPGVKKKFCGHRNSRTMIKESTFWGNDHVMSGSDCGHIFIWDRYTAELVMILEADRHVVNCLQPHPFDPILASSGIDYDIKLWAPTRNEPFFDKDKAEEVVRINEIMLEETKDTITVPASFMIRMLSSLNHLRSRGSRTRDTTELLRSDPSSDDDSN